MFKRIKRKLARSIIDEIQKTASGERDVIRDIRDEEMIMSKVGKEKARLAKLRVQIERLEEKKRLMKDIREIPDAWLLRLKDRVEDELIDTERNQVEPDRKIAQEKLNLLNLIIKYAQDNRGKNS